ncbi:amino acid adenylation domain-containing protein [Actinophytocola sp.]|uniref:amino acid adenylation domain-containing protein n=1 Tax=Actinophytocola sp. TaxID=1872138 RepID=UPI00389A61D5
MTYSSRQADDGGDLDDDDGDDLDDGADLVEDMYPLSPLQRGLLFHFVRDPDAAEYINQLTMRVHGVAPAGVRDVWQLLAERHPVLRTGFLWDGLDDPVQVVYRWARLPIEVHDLRGLPAAERDRASADFIHADRLRGFRLDEPPPARLSLLRVDDDVVDLVWTHHAIILDGWSSGLLLADLERIQAALATGTPPPPVTGPPFRDYLTRLGERDPGQDSAYWREVLAGVDAPTPLPLADKPAPDTTDEGVQHELWLSGEESGRIRAAAAQLRIPFGVLAQGAWALTLSRYVRTDDVLFGMVVSGRTVDMPGIDEIIGTLTNTVPVRVDLAPGRTRTVREWLHGLADRHSAAMAHEHSPLTDVTRLSGLPGGRPLFETVLVVQNHPVATGSDAGGGPRITRVRGHESMHYPLVVFLIPGERIGVRISYRRGVVTDRAARLLADSVRAALTGLTEPGRPVDAVAVFGAQAEAHDTPAEGPSTRWAAPATVPEVFTEAVAAAPDAPAVLRDGIATHSYRELDERAEQLACALAAVGAGVERRVGVLLARSAESVIAMLGVLKTGAVYVPVDPAYPADRVAYLLSDSACDIVVTSTGLRDLVPAGSARILCVDEPVDVAAPRPRPAVLPDNLAYLIYTSGSTGRPKGVMVSHRAVLNTLLWLTDEFALRRGHVVAHKVPVSFTDAVLEVLWPLCAGAAVAVLHAEVTRDPDAFTAALRANHVTHAQLVPRQIEGIAAAAARDGGRDPVPELTWVVNGSETLPASFVSAWDEVCENARIHNIYGMTESAIFAVWHTMARGEAARTGVAPIGMPMPNTTVRVLNAALEPCPPGVAGELYIGGTGVARGYLGRPGMTADRFVPDPLGPPGARLYRTGDLGHWLPGGGLDDLGRVDFQVKVRGLRVEPGEVEVALRGHPHVRDAVVVGHEDRLVGYLVGPRHERPPAGVVRAWLAGSLPAHLVPAILMWLDELPMTQHGKVDRRRLPAPAAERDLVDGYVAPRTELEETLCGLWAATLKLGQVGVYDDFFAVGGDSLLAIRLVGRVREAVPVDYTVAALFDAPTVAGAAARLTELLSEMGDELGALLDEIENLPS